MKAYSITRRLILTILIIESATALCFTATAIFHESHTHFRAFNIMLRGRADSLLGAVQDAEDPGDNVMLDGTELSAPHDDVYQVTDATGHVLGRSSNWNGPSAENLTTEHDRDRHAGGDAEFFQARLNGNAYRIIRIQGLRIVDPGDKGGGIPRGVIIYYGAETKRVWMAVIRGAGFYVLSSVVVLTASGFLMMWLLNRGLAPLSELATAARKVSVFTWDFAPPPSARAIQELAPLITALESLLAGLERSFAQQRRFVGDAAHELKTGVAVVKSSLQLLSLRPRTSVEYKAGVTRSLADCERMESLVARMLTLARIEEGVNTSSTSENRTAQPTALLHGLREAASSLAGIAEEHHVSVCFRGKEETYARIPEESLHLLATNLLLNAIQHSPAGSEIIVTVAQSNVDAIFQIEDFGEGIAANDLPYIFERFYRSDPSRSRKTGGTGLGLAISKAIVEQHRGAIAIESAPGRGTTITVTLPAGGPAEDSL